MEDTTFPLVMAGRTLEGFGLREEFRSGVLSVSMPNRETLIVHTSDVLGNAVITADLRPPLVDGEPARARVSVLDLRGGTESVIAEALQIKHSEWTPDPEVVTAIVKHFSQEVLKGLAHLKIAAEVRRLAAALLEGPDLMEAVGRDGVKVGVERDGSDVIYTLRLNMGPSPTFGPGDLYGT